MFLCIPYLRLSTGVACCIIPTTRFVQPNFSLFIVEHLSRESQLGKNVKDGRTNMAPSR